MRQLLDAFIVLLVAVCFMTISGFILYYQFIKDTKTKVDFPQVSKELQSAKVDLAQDKADIRRVKAYQAKQDDSLSKQKKEKVHKSVSTKEVVQKATVTSISSVNNSRVNTEHKLKNTEVVTQAKRVEKPTIETLSLKEREEIAEAELVVEKKEEERVKKEKEDEKRQIAFIESKTQRKYTNTVVFKPVVSQKNSDIVGEIESLVKSAKVPNALKVSQ